MNTICLLVVILVVALLVVGVIREWLFDRRLFRWRRASPGIVAQCIECHGRGWIEHTQRTLNFDGQGFEDVPGPATMCTACNGSGRVIR